MWRNGGGSLVKKVDAHSDASDDEVDGAVKRPKFQRMSVKKRQTPNSVQALEESPEHSTSTGESMPITDA